MENCYLLFVKTGYEERVVDKLKTKLDSSLFLPFVPTKEKFFRRNGITTKEKELCFIGYVFVESELYSDEFIVKMSPIIRTFGDIYKIVNYGNKRDIAMRENEQFMLNSLYGSKHCVEASVGFMEGDIIRIEDGSLIGMESTIKKMNRHKREAIIEIELMGALRRVTVGLEILKKI